MCDVPRQAGAYVKAPLYPYTIHGKYLPIEERYSVDNIAQYPTHMLTR